jgi:hypothetical protein
LCQSDALSDEITCRRRPSVGSIKTHKQTGPGFPPKSRGTPWATSAIDQNAQIAKSCMQSSQTVTPTKSACYPWPDPIASVTPTRRPFRVRYDLGSPHPIRMHRRNKCSKQFHNFHELKYNAFWRTHCEPGGPYFRERSSRIYQQSKLNRDEFGNRCRHHFPSKCDRCGFWHWRGIASVNLISWRQLYVYS